MTKDKIRYSPEPLPEIMWGIGYKVFDKIHLEWKGYSDNFREGYLLLFKTEIEAQEYINKMNNKYNALDDGSRTYWYKNRNCYPTKVKTQLKKYKSKYRPLSSFAMSELFG